MDRSNLRCIALTLFLVAGPAGADEFALIEAAPPGPSARFGRPVALQGDRLVVGSPATDVVTVYAHSNGVWTLQAQLSGNDTQGGDWFGGSLALDGDTLVVGARFHDHDVPLGNPLLNNGAAYVFVEQGGVWTQEGKLTTQDSADFDWFGHSVAIDADTVLVGVPFDQDIGFGSGSAFVFDRVGTTWSETTKLLGSDTGGGDFFGWDVAVEGDRGLVGADLADAAGVDSGAIYAFSRTGGPWVQTQKLTGSDSASGDQFGNALSLDGGTVVVGALLADVGALIDAGAAYVFVLGGSTWTQQQKLTAAGGVADDLFGSDVALEGDRAVVGAPHDGLGGFANGQAFGFARSGSVWSQDEQLFGSDTQVDDSYGGAVGVSLTAGAYAVGAPNRDDVAGGNSDSGAVYVHLIGGNPQTPIVYCTPKVSSAGCTTTIAVSNPSLPPTSGANDYSVLANSVQGAKAGIFFFGLTGQAAISFSGGTLCMMPPIGRTPLQFSGGSSPTSCDGAFALVINNGTSLFDPGPGATAWFQTWYRDPQNGAGSLGTALSNAVEVPFL